MLSVLPSYTALGMASLLPHDTMAYKPTGEVLVDGLSTSGIPARDAFDEVAGITSTTRMACKL